MTISPIYGCGMWGAAGRTVGIETTNLLVITTDGESIEEDNGLGFQFLYFHIICQDRIVNQPDKTLYKLGRRLNLNVNFQDSKTVRP